MNAFLVRGLRLLLARFRPAGRALRRHPRHDAARQRSERLRPDPAGLRLCRQHMSRRSSGAAPTGCLAIQHRAHVGRDLTRRQRPVWRRFPSRRHAGQSEEARQVTGGALSPDAGMRPARCAEEFIRQRIVDADVGCAASKRAGPPRADRAGGDAGVDRLGHRVPDGVAAPLLRGPRGCGPRRGRASPPSSQQLGHLSATKWRMPHAFTLRATSRRAVSAAPAVEGPPLPPVGSRTGRCPRRHLPHARPHRRRRAPRAHAADRSRRGIAPCQRPPRGGAACMWPRQRGVRALRNAALCVSRCARPTDGLPNVSPLPARPSEGGRGAAAAARPPGSPGHVARPTCGRAGCVDAQASAHPVAGAHGLRLRCGPRASQLGAPSARRPRPARRTQRRRAHLRPVTRAPSGHTHGGPMHVQECG